LVVDDLESKIVNINKARAVKISITFEKNSSLDNLYNFVSKIESDYAPIELKLSHE
jgi:hypothetical protein